MLTPEQIVAARIEVHRERIAREMPLAEAEEMAQRYDRLAGFRSKRIKGKPRRSSRSTLQVLVERLDHLERMCRNPGWSVR